MSNKNTVKLQGIDFTSDLVRDLWKSIDRGLHNAIITRQNEGLLLDDEYLVGVAMTYTDIVQLRNVENMLNSNIIFKSKYIKHINAILDREEYKPLIDELKERLAFWENERKVTWKVVNEIVKSAKFKEDK